MPHASADRVLGRAPHASTDGVLDAGHSPWYQLLMSHEPDRRFSGKVVLITGASSGIGAAIARRFAGEGATVVLAARDRASLESLAQELRAAGHSAEPVPTDSADLSAIRAMVDRTLEIGGRLDVLVNNTGVDYRGDLEQHTPEQLAPIVQENLGVPIVLSYLALPHLTRVGGAIVNVASLAGRIPVVHEPTYAATKLGLQAFSHAAAEELSGAGVRVSVVSPGPADTGVLTEDRVRPPPTSSADQIAELVVECAANGPMARTERARPEVVGSAFSGRRWVSLVSKFSHDVNTPLGVVRTAGSTIADMVRDLVQDPPEDPEEIEELRGDLRDALALLDRNLDRAQEIIVDFKQLSLLQLSNERAVVKLDQLIAACASAMRSELERSKIRVELDVRPGIDYKWDSFPGYLTQVLVHLLQNAMRHAFEGLAQGRVGIHLTREDAETGDFIIRFADDGHGMEPEILRPVFDPVETSSQGKGNQRGLVHCHNLVVGLLGGSIRCESEEGKGTVFTMRLPAVIREG